MLPGLLTSKKICLLICLAPEKHLYINLHNTHDRWSRCFWKCCYLVSNIVSFADAGINNFHHTPSREWFQTDAVLRVSFGNFLFFTILAILMVGVKNQRDPRDGLHHGGWMMKIICWCLLVIFMFFLPNEIINFYGKCCCLMYACFFFLFGDYQW